MPNNFDWQEVVFLVLVVVVSFVRWIINVIQQKKEARERDRPMTEEERRARDAAWRRQTGQDQDDEEGDYGPATQPQPRPASDPFSELRDLFEQAREAQRQREKPPAVPPPLLVPQRPAIPAATVRKEPPPVPVMAPALTKAVSVSAARASAAYDIQSGSAGKSSQQLQSLRRMIANPESLRQAILMREILGPPKALRSDSTL